MLGLEIEIDKRKTGKKSNPKEKFSCTYISKLLGKTYMAVNHKINRKSFGFEEALAIFKSIVPEDRQTLDFFIYLFTEQN